MDLHSEASTEMKDFLEESRLGHLWESIHADGYDDFESLMEMTDVELEKLLDDISVTQKGTRRRFLKVVRTAQERKRETAVDFQIASCSNDNPLREKERKKSTTSIKPELYQRVSLGWIKNPKRPTGIFYNKIMPKFYQSFWPYRDQPTLFKAGFRLERERERQWGEREFELNQKRRIDVCLDEKSEFGGSVFLKEQYEFEVKDAVRIQRLKEELNVIKTKLEERGNNIRAHTESLFTEKGILKSGYDFHKEFNFEINKELADLGETISNYMTTLNGMRNVPMATKTEVAKRRSSYNNKWKAKKRKDGRLIDRVQLIYNSLGGEGDFHGSPLESGISQIDMLSDSLDEIILRGLDTEALEYLYSRGTFVCQAETDVSEFLKNAKLQ